MTERSKMKLHPFAECAKRADQIIRASPAANVYQQWICAHCGVKQTMPDANKFYTFGRCEECGKQTDIQRDGMNYMITTGLKLEELFSPPRPGSR